MTTEVTACACPMWEKPLGELFPLWFDRKMNEWGLAFFTRDGVGSIVFYFCPSCGGAMPKSAREHFFTKPTDGDLDAARTLTAGISSLAELEEKLGPPDHQIPLEDEFKEGEGPHYRRQWVYSGKWKSLELIALEDFERRVSFAFVGHYLPDGSGAV